MKTTLGAIAVTLALTAGVNGASAMPASETGLQTTWEQVFEPRN